MNMLDYIDWRGDLTFEQDGFNEVDNLVFSELAYTDMRDIVPEDGSRALTVAQVYGEYKAAGIDQSLMMNDPLPVLEKAAQSPRFKDITVKWYVDKIDTEQHLQFAAVTFIISDKLAYVAFRGTDNTIVGWREDFNISFLSETPGQTEAVAYVNRIAKLTDCKLIVGGHSKGGNFAVYACAFCDKDISEKRVIKIYTNDGPGFMNEVAESENYLSILSKTIKISPDSSPVGLFFLSKAERKVIKSDSKGFMQHNPYKWHVLGAEFESADARTDPFINMTISSWLNTMTDSNKKILVDYIFDSLEASGVTSFNELADNKWNSFNSIFKALTKIDPNDKTDIASSIKKLIASGKDVVISEKQKNAEIKKAEKNKVDNEKQE
ncbi:Mbeg1-like protein [Ruminococcus sp. JL13D9]|uniref:Mbeg1-like protein n=1 Tax=Ruminococcus sp. JL13D9 TaxID=3233381 RepID=UPI003899DEFD